MEEGGRDARVDTVVVGRYCESRLAQEEIHQVLYPTAVFFACDWCPVGQLDTLHESVCCTTLGSRYSY
jgi:hypothetical protein